MARVLKVRIERLFQRLQLASEASEAIDTHPKRKSEFMVRCSKLAEDYVEFEDLVQRYFEAYIAENPDDSTIDQKLKLECKMYEEMYYPLLAKYKELLPSCTQSQNQETYPRKNIRLPQIELKVFKGTLSDWPGFYSNFTSLIHRNTSLDSVAKFHYLISSLSGPPLAIVTELEITAENYEISWNNLVKRYQNTRLLASDVLSKLFNYTPLNKESNKLLSDFLTVFEEGIQSLKALKIDDLADFILLFSALRVLPNSTKQAFERHNIDTKVPTIKQLLNFIREQSVIHEVAHISAHDSKPNLKNEKLDKFTKRALLASQNTANNCPCCSKPHLVSFCPEFEKLDIPARRNFVKSNKLCFNCLKSGHSVKTCKSIGRCKVCRAAHHSLVHQPATMAGASAPHSSHNSESLKHSSLTALAPAGENTVLLGTAVLQVQGRSGRFYTVRGVIDSAATTSYITTACARRIGLRYERLTHPVGGIGGQVASFAQGRATCRVKPHHTDEPVLSTETLIIENITGDLPSTCLPPSVRHHMRGLPLADPEFWNPKEVHFLLGADCFPFIYTGDKKLGSHGYPPALASIFGWVITGKVGHKSCITSRPTALLSDVGMNSILRRFWEIEEIPKLTPPHADDLLCEKIFSEQHYRLADGRYVVPLMLKEDPPPLGDSRCIALRSLKGIERRLSKNPALQADYSDFLSEYLELGHMDLVAPENSNQVNFYIPHHCVVREDSVSTRVRVVFNASQKTTLGTSLNDYVFKGPKLQHEIFDVILKFRTHQVVFTCDIRKMYRQILIRPQERKYQHIFWREKGKIKEYELNTVTYGVTSAPYLALRTLHQLAKDDGHNFPRAAKALVEDIYVDDLPQGSQDIPSALDLQHQLIELLKLGGFSLGKWASNRPELLKHLRAEDCVTSLSLNDENSTLKILGLRWDAKSDSFSYNALITPHKATKRNVLSQLAKLWDPLGFVCPIVFQAKVFMQKLWLQGVDWDTPLSSDLQQEWNNFCENLPAIANIRIKRWVTLDGAPTHSLIGFSDASQLGYGSTVYLRSETDQSVQVSLLAAKSRVAPTKTVSIPRLELCGAQLLSELFSHCQLILGKQLKIKSVHAFTDSEVVLDWLKTIPCRLKTFEANRVTLILEKIEPSAWRHVSSHENPADLASRGCTPQQLQTSALWWNGPEWLTSPVNSWPISRSKSGKIQDKVESGLKVKAIPALLATNMDFWDKFMSRFSRLKKLQRVTAWLLRYIENLKLPLKNRNLEPTLSVEELESSLIFLVKRVQQKHFSNDFKLLETTANSSKQLQSLQPFVDKDGILRVGGRLRNASLPFEQTHPILLPKRDHLVNLVIDDFHERYLHAGPRLLQSLLARQFWIMAARSIIRSRLSKCITCFRVKPTGTTPMMADLPASRVKVSKVFTEVAVDYGGPFLVREHKRRNPKLTKAYLCLFVCMTTKAVHLEVVSELTTDAFLSSFDRFVGRRGLCRTIFSDNATNFTGAKRHLSELFDFLIKNEDRIRTELSANKVEWRFIPANAPHFGGLHEAGIKSAKYHLKRVIGTQTLTFEELTTAFVKIEAIMNSRPLCSLSTDVAEVNVLTPGHFLVGGPLVAVPEPDFTSTKINRLSRWQLVQQLSQHFWKIWSQDYLHTLQQRNKWHTTTENPKRGDVVIVSDPDTAPTHWKKGIIEALHPGKDGIVRVVTVRTATGSLKRPMVKIYRLPRE